MVLKTAVLLSTAFKVLKPKNIHTNLLTACQLNSTSLEALRISPKLDNIQLSAAFDKSSEVDKNEFLQDMLIYEDFLTAAEEESLFSEVDPFLKRLRYEFDHWDDAIHGYRETERLDWNQDNSVTLQKLRELAFPPGSPQLAHVHVLDLAPNGLIKPHIDAVRFCGNTIAGLSLLSDCVMRLIHDKKKLYTADILLKRRSLYIMKNSARYDYTHEILGESESVFNNQPVLRDRRISIICRNEPDAERSS